MGKLSIGMVGTYPRDRQFCHFMDIPVSVALEWVKSKFPDTKLGRDLSAKELTLDNYENEWLNKAYIIIGGDHDQWIALCNSDGNFSIQHKKIEPSDFKED